MMDPASMLERVDENTIMVVPTLGVTYTGAYEPVEAMAAALDKLQADTGLDIDIHVDAASGGFLAPFCAPDVAFDFRLPRVKSISASGHKFGLAPLGVGWVVWRDVGELPDDLIFHVNYLGGDMPTFTLNFSRPGNQLIGQYYNFVRLGREGYTRIFETLRDIAVHLSTAIGKMDAFDVISDGSAIPVLAFKVSDPDRFTVFHVSDELHKSGWQVPAYTMPDDATDVAVLRIVVREGLGMDLADALITEIQKAVEHLDAFPPSHPPTTGTGFSHT
jgi:glutamate decarboxylase